MPVFSCPIKCRSGGCNQFRGNRQRYQKEGCQNLHALAFEMSDGIANGGCVFTCTQLLLPAAAEAMVRSGCLARQHELHVRQRHLRYDNRRNVMRFVDLLHADGQIRRRLASISQMRA